MATEYLLPNGGGTGWDAGDYTDVNAGGIAPSSGGSHNDSDAITISGTGKEGTAFTLDLADSDITTADTVTQVDVYVRARTVGSGVDTIDVELLIGGSPVGSTYNSGGLEQDIYNNFSAIGSSLGWTTDWSASQLDGMQVRVTAQQGGSPVSIGHQVSEVEVVVTYTDNSVTIDVPVGSTSTQGYASSLGFSWITRPGVGSVAITGYQSGRIEYFPDAGSVSLAGYAPSPIFGLTISPNVGTLTFEAYAVSVPLFDIALDVLSITGYAAQARTANSGTAIKNANATTDSGNRYNICDVSGFKAKPGQLVPRWDGKMVLPEFWEPRHPQEFVRSKGENQRGAKRPEPVGNETFLSDGEVTVDDL